MAPRFKPKPKPKVTRKGVSKQEKAAATRGGFVKADGKADVAAYRKHKAKIASLGGLPTGPSPKTDTKVAARKGMTVTELEKQRKKVLAASIAKEAEATGKTVAEVKAAREARSTRTKGSKRQKRASKRAYVQAKETKVKKDYTDREKELVDKAKEGKLTSKERTELEGFAKQRKDAGRPSLTIPLAKPELEPAGKQYEAGIRKLEPSSDSKIIKLRNQRVKRFNDQINKLKKAKKELLKRIKELKISKARAKKRGVKITKTSPYYTGEYKRRLDLINENLPILEEKKKDAAKLNRFKPLYSFERSNKPLSGLATLLDKVIEAPPSKAEEPTALGGKTQIKGMPKSVKTIGPSTHPVLERLKSSKEKMSDKVVKDITRTLVDKGVSKRLALKVANKQPLTSAERKRIKNAGVNITFGPWAKQRPNQLAVNRMLGKGTVPKPGIAPTPTRKLTKREREVQADPNVEKGVTAKWKPLTGLQKILDTLVGPPKKATGKSGQGRDKLLPGNVTAAQLSDILGVEDVSKLSNKALKGLLIEGGFTVKGRKKGGTVYRKTGGQVSRGTGAALRGFGKATYSHKLY